VCVSPIAQGMSLVQPWVTNTRAWHRLFDESSAALAFTCSGVLASLVVHTHLTRSPRRRITVAASMANRSAVVSAARQPPAASNQRGLVK
jgi:hypothetical protein